MSRFEMGDKMNNFWGDPDDEPLPAWMDPKTYREGGAKFKGPQSKSVEEIAAEMLKKPAIDLTNVSWDNWKPNKDM